MKKIFNSVYLILLLCFLGMLLFVLALAIYSFNDLQNKIEQEQNNILLQRAHVVSEAINDNIDSLLLQEIILSFDQRLQLFALNADEEADLEYIRQLRSSLNLIAMSSKIVKNIYIVFLQRKEYIDVHSYNSYDNFPQIFQVNSREDSLFYFNEHRLFVKPVYSQNYKAFNDFVIFTEIDVNNFKEFILEKKNGSDFGSVIIEDKLIGDDLHEYAGHAKNAVFSLSIGGVDYQATVRQDKGFDILYLLRVDNYVQSISAYKLLSLFTILLGILGISLYFFISYKYIKHPLNSLQTAFKKLQDEEHGYQLSGKPFGEFGYLYDAFNKTSAELDKLIKEKYENKILLQSMEMKQLQSQINPHFLFNIFYMLKAELNKGEYKNAEEIAKNISDYFKYVISNQKYITLIEEYEYVKNYIEIQTRRVKGKVKAFIDDIPFEFYDKQIPKFILQPIIENAFRYVFENTLGKCELYIKNEVRDGYIIISVEDSGNISDTEIENIKQIISSPDDRLDRMSALFNIHNRLKVYNNSDKGLELKRSGLGGLRVIIYLKAS